MSCILNQSSLGKPLCQCSGEVTSVCNASVINNLLISKKSLHVYYKQRSLDQCPMPLNADQIMALIRNASQFLNQVNNAVRNTFYETVY